MRRVRQEPDSRKSRSQRQNRTRGQGTAAVTRPRACLPRMQTRRVCCGKRGEEVGGFRQPRMCLRNVLPTYRFHPEDRYSTGPRPATFRNSSTP